jgi:hypothetical protein
VKLAEYYRCSFICLLLGSENGEGKFLRNVRFSPNYILLQLRQPYSALPSQGSHFRASSLTSSQISNALQNTTAFGGGAIRLAWHVSPIIVLAGVGSNTCRLHSLQLQRSDPNASGNIVIP